METPKKCPKCSGDMVRGFVPDYGHTAIFTPRWHEGSPKKSIWSGTSMPKSNGIPIAAFWCSSCGFLEFYADKTFAPK